MAIRFGKEPGEVGHRPAVGALAKKINAPFEDIIKAVKNSRRLQGGKTKDKHFLPETAERLEDWKVRAIARSNPHAWQTRWPPRPEAEDEEAEEAEEEPQRTVGTLFIGNVDDISPAIKHEVVANTKKE